MAREASLSVTSYSLKCMDPAHCIMAEAARQLVSVSTR